MSLNSFLRISSLPLAMGVVLVLSNSCVAQSRLNSAKNATAAMKTSADAEFEAALEIGKELFHRDWTDKSKVKLSGNADGLGPLYNAVSCVACHGQGGSGGGGNNSHNVLLLTRTTTVVEDAEFVLPATEKDFTKTWHPGLVSTSSIVLHRFSTNESYQGALKQWLSWEPVMVLGKLTDPDRLNLSPTSFDNLPRLDSEQAHALAIVRTQRNTPSLFGLGWIDAIPEHVLARVSETQNKKFPEISGRVAPNGGKFGWRGQTSSVKNFVVGACANELGLQTPGFQQPSDPTNTSSHKSSAHTDMSPEEVNALVSYVDQLPPPEQIRPIGREAKTLWEEGRRHFYSARCDACHVRQIGAVDGIYSDLLLHEMGEKLNDPAALASTAPTSLQYYGTGDSFIVSDERKQEWRTPPLWGVRDSAPYLHDGSARTLDDAIMAHGGEAETSRKLYEALNQLEQNRLIEFLKSLGSEKARRYVAR